MDCQALRDVLLSEELNATHSRWQDGVLAHQIVDVRHIPGRINLVGNSLSRKGEEQPHIDNDGSVWLVTPDWEEARGLTYDLFTIDTPPTTLHSTLREHFKDERIFVEVVDAILGITDNTSDADRKKAAHHAEGYFIEEGKLWKLGGYTPSRATARRECVTKAEATQMARIEHSKLHMHRDMLRNQLLDNTHSPLLDASISTAILECG